MDQLQDRADVPIWNAIEAGNYKGALKLVDKRLSKKPTTYLEALKVYIRSCSTTVSEKAAVLLHLEEVSREKKPLVDLAAIELYDNALEQVLGTADDWARIIGEIRWQCVKAISKDEDISLKCFKACLLKKDLDHARQIANSLEKCFPSNRNYIFWNLSTMFLFSMSPTYAASQTKLWGSLAFAQISKLAAATRQNKGGDQLPSRSIQTPQELLLLHLITKTCGKPEQQLEYLEDENLGPESAVSKGEWEIWRMKLKLMQNARRWDDLFNITGSLLERSRTKDKSGQLTEAPLSDWVVWEAYIRSAYELGDQLSRSKVRTEIEAHLDPGSGIDKSWRRNASLAWVKVAFEDAGAFTAAMDTGKMSTTSLKCDTILKYLADYGDATTAYSDLRPYVEKLTTEERKQLLGLLDTTSTDLSSAKLITKATNLFKLRYLLMCSLPESERYRSLKIEATKDYKCITCGNSCGRFCQHCLTGTAKDAIQSYKSALNDDGDITKHLLVTDRHPADDLCILSATCLIKVGLMDNSQGAEPLSKSKSQYFLQAAALLEKAWVHSKPNFQISLMLVRLYTFLGCGSLAMRAYQRLALKQIQLDTLSYVLFDRISTFHPKSFTSHAGESDSDRTPIQHLQRQQKVYKHAYEQISKNMWLSFKNGSYNAMYQIQGIEKELSCGLGSTMSVIESRRICRITSPGTPVTAVSHGYNLLAPYIETSGALSADNLDYKSFPNYESTLGTSLEELSRIAPAPSAHRYHTNLITEKLLLITSPSTPSSEQAMLLAWLHQHLQAQSQHTAVQLGDVMTQPENLAHQAYQSMVLIISIASDQEQWTDSDFITRLQSCNKDLAEVVEQTANMIEGFQGQVPAYFDTLHALYTAYEVGKAVLGFTAYMGRQGKNVYKSQVEENTPLVEVANRLLVTVEKQCVVIKKGMDEGWIDKVLECAMGEGTLLDEDNFMEEWAGEVVESWRESVAGLSYLKAS